MRDPDDDTREKATMRYVSFDHAGAPGHGYLDGDEVAVLGSGHLDLQLGTPGTAVTARLALDDVRLRAPIARPGKIIGVAANYQEHVREGGADDRVKAISTPRLFLKPDTSLAGPDDPVVRPPVTRTLDWEAELGVVIGAEGRDIPVGDALDHVFGYVTANDISARSLDFGTARDGQEWTVFFDWLAGKWLDASAPIGPWLVAAADVPDPQDLGLTLTVNGVVRQRSTTAAMIFSVAELVSFASRLMTLRPGDLILTGTPAGVGAATGDYLEPGDVMVAEIEGLGALRTPVAAD